MEHSSLIRNIKKEYITAQNEFSLPQIPEEEIKKYTIDDNLSEIERIKILLTKKNVI